MNPKKPTFRVASLPGPASVSADALPYVTLFYEALRPHGIECVAELVPNAAWLERHAQELDAIHIHWPENIWRTSHWGWVRRLCGLRGVHRLRQITRLPRSLLGLHYLRQLLDCAKGHGLRIIWTFHDAQPHGRPGRLDRVGYRVVAQLCDAVICHSEASRDAFVRAYGFPSKTLIMRHGNFSSSYPPARPRNAVLHDLGLREDLPMVCSLGALRSYKGVDLCLDAAALLHGEVQLVVGGAPHSDFGMRAFSRRISRIPNAVSIPRELSPQEFSDIAGASEAFLLPYRRITTSGVLLAAFTFHRGVIASDLPYFREYLQDNADCGRLFSPNDGAALAPAISDYLTVPMAVRTAASQRMAELHSWDKVIVPVVEMIVKWHSKAL